MNPDVAETSQAQLDVIKVLEERLTIAKRVVETGGGIRLRKIVHAQTVDVTEPLSLESLSVKRITLNRDVDAPVAIRYEGEVTIFPVVEERLITRKQLVLVEEIHVSKVQQTDRSTQQVTLRREEVIAERQDPVSGEWSVIGAGFLRAPCAQRGDEPAREPRQHAEHR